MSESGDQVLWTIAANSVQGGTAVGGGLALTTSALVFVPHGIERAVDGLLGTPLEGLLALFGREERSEGRVIPLAVIASLDTAERDFSFTGVMSGGLRERLRVTRTSREEALFVVGSVEDAIERIRAALPS